MEELNPLITQALQQSQPVLSLVGLMEHHKDCAMQAACMLGTLRDRQAIPHLLRAARLNENNSVYLFALSQFNCEEYLEKLIDIGLNSGVNAIESRLQVVQIIMKIIMNTPGISQHAKEKLETSLLLARELMLNEKNSQRWKREFLEDCLTLVLDLPVAEKAQVVNLKVRQ